MLNRFHPMFGCLLERTEEPSCLLGYYLEFSLPLGAMITFLQSSL